MINLLQQLTGAIGPSGFEQSIARLVHSLAVPLADTVRVDPLGNVIATIRGERQGAPSVIVSAHMDEVGFIVRKIEANGWVRFNKVGGHDDRILSAQQVRIQTHKGPVHGVIGTISAHHQGMDDTAKIRRYRELYIDCGVDSAEEAAELGIVVGDPIAWATEVRPFGNNRIIGKAFDDRAGCAVQLKTLERLHARRQPGDVHFLFSVQEEVGLRGASVGAFSLDPTFAIAVDTTAVSDTPEGIMDRSLQLGKGPGIKVMDASLVAHPVVRDHLFRTAEELALPCQREVFSGIGTDAGGLHLTKAGIPSGVISVPSRYAHSPVEVMDLGDLGRCVDLLEGALRGIEQIAGRSFID